MLDMEVTSYYLTFKFTERAYTSDRSTTSLWCEAAAINWRRLETFDGWLETRVESPLRICSYV